MDTKELRRIAEAVKEAPEIRWEDSSCEYKTANEWSRFSERFDPPTVLALLDEVDRLRAAITKR